MGLVLVLAVVLVVLGTIVLFLENFSAVWLPGTLGDFGCAAILLIILAILIASFF